MDEHRLKWMPECQVGSVVTPASDTGGGETLYGLLLAGIPFGSDAFVQMWMADKLESERSNLDKVVSRLGTLSAHALWSSVLFCIHPRIVYWLQHLPPRHTGELARGFDEMVRSAAETALRVEFPIGSLAHARLMQPVSNKGGGLRSMETLAPAAYAATVATVLPLLVERVVEDRVMQGYCTQLGSRLGGADQFNETSEGPVHASPLQPFIRGGSQTAVDFVAAWEQCRGEVGTVMTGPLSVQAGAAGFHRTDDGPFNHVKLQRQLTAQLEEAARGRLLERMAETYATSPRDPQLMAAKNVDVLSAQWVTTWPTRELNLESQELGEVAANYFGLPSPVCRPIVGQPVRQSNSKSTNLLGGRGDELRSSNMSGDGFRTSHDTLTRVVTSTLKPAGMKAFLEPAGLFALATLVADNGVRKKGSITPDIMVETKGNGVVDRMHLVDVKSLHVAKTTYPTPRREPEQCSAVNVRARKVNQEYLSRAKKVDEDGRRRGSAPRSSGAAAADEAPTTPFTVTATDGGTAAAPTALASGDERHGSRLLGGEAATVGRQVASAEAEEGSGPEAPEGTSGGGGESLQPRDSEGLDVATPAADASATTASGAGAPGTMGPAEALLKSYPAVQGLVYGTYAEFSDFGHTLLEEAAKSAATKDYMIVGARSKQEAFAFFLGLFRRTWGVVAARENARLLIRRAGVHLGPQGAAAAKRRTVDGHLLAARAAFDYRRGPACFPMRGGRWAGAA